jgi:1-acyl-sn-glycerol-3-phosphate acyltransferase
MKTDLKSFLVSFYIWGFLIITIIPIFLLYTFIWIVAYPFDPKKTITHYYTSLWAGLYLAINPGWKISIENKQNINPHVPYIFVSNHQSLLDIALLSQLYIKFRWISKIELAKIPVLGWVIRMNKHILVRRGERESIYKMTRACKKSLSEGISIFIFPEGTRSSDGNLLPFKDGAFILAKETGIPIMPVLIHGASIALPKESFFFRGRQHFRIRVLEEVTKETIINSSPELLKDYTWKIMSENLKKMD